MTQTGRRLPGPAADLVQLNSSKGLKHTAILFKEVFRGADCLNAELQSCIPFMENPGVSGIVPLVHHDRDEGSFVYSTGTVWSIAEVVRAFADLGETCGHRAGLELAYVTSQILVEASDKGSPVGVWSHRSLSPWTLALRGDGQVRVLGYGLPQVELIEFLAHESTPIREDSFRYAPPERIEGRDEDITSDLFALTLIAVELMVGKPVYDGLLADVRQQAARAEGTYRLYRWRDLLPATIRDALAPALKYDDDARYRDPAEYVYAMHDLLGSPDIQGPSLMEIVQRVKMAERKGKPIVSGRTAALTRDELAAMAAELDEPEDMPLPPPSMPRPNAVEPEPDPNAEVPRWGSVARSGRRSRSVEPVAAVPEPEPAPPSRVVSRSRANADKAEQDRAKSLRERLRRSRSEGPPSRSLTESSVAEDDPRDALRRRLRERPSASGSLAPPPTPAPPPVRAREPAAASPPEPTEPVVSLSSSSGDAEALLARLRGSSGRRRGLSARDLAVALPSALAESGTQAQAPPEGLQWQLRVDQRTVPVVIAVGQTIAEAAARLARDFAPARVDLSGRVVSAARLSQEGRWWRGHEDASLIDASKPVELVQVPNTTVSLEVRIDTTPAHRFVSPVALAVPAKRLIAHLVAWLDLPDGDWHLVLDDTQLVGDQLLADLEPHPGQILMVRR